MANGVVQSSRDWLSSPRASVLAWWIPKGVIVAALFIPPPARADPKDEYQRYVEKVKKYFPGPIFLAKDLMQF
jgi:hypothetical protein